MDWMAVDMGDLVIWLETRGDSRMIREGGTNNIFAVYLVNPYTNSAKSFA